MAAYLTAAGAPPASGAKLRKGLGDLRVTPHLTEWVDQPVDATPGPDRAKAGGPTALL